MDTGIGHAVRSATRAAAGLLLFTLIGCPTADEPPVPGLPPTDPSTLCSTPGASRCDGLERQVCVEGRWFGVETCQAPRPWCDPEIGCTTCAPELPFCAGSEVWLCGAEGATASLLETCAVDEACLLGACLDACELAEETESYLGCRFLAVSTPNPLLDPPFWEDFAVAVANAWAGAAAEITVRQGEQVVATTTVHSGELGVIPLSLEPRRQPAVPGVAASAVVVDGAYEITSSLPVAAYQFNPLHFELEDENSHTADASLLLPEHVQTGSYMASTWPTMAFAERAGIWSWYPGFVTVAATEDGTTVTLTASGQTQPGEGLPGLGIGEQLVVGLDRGDVLLVMAETPSPSTGVSLCDQRDGDEAGAFGIDTCVDRTLGDLTGTRIEGDRPLAVFAGHVCTFLPSDAFACDHMEEVMLPTETWGVTSGVPAPAWPDRPDTRAAPAAIRILSLEDDNDVRFSPEVHESVTLASGEHVEFFAGQDFIAEAERPLQVSQALLGIQALDSWDGDPALGLGSPLSQWRSEYDLLAPDTYTENWVSVFAPGDARVFLDGFEIVSWEPVEGTAWVAARVPLEPGAHRLQSVDDVGFGITAYGYGFCTSYLYPGGMNFLR